MSETSDYFILTIKMKQLGEKLFKRNTPPNLYIILKTFSEKSERAKILLFYLCLRRKRVYTEQNLSKKPRQAVCLPKDSISNSNLFPRLDACFLERAVPREFVFCPPPAALSAGVVTLALTKQSTNTCQSTVIKAQNKNYQARSDLIAR